MGRRLGAGSSELTPRIFNKNGRSQGGVALACDQPLSVAKHVNETFTDAQADGAMSKANTALQTVDVSGDVSCPIIFRRLSSVGNLTGANTINTDSELKAVLANTRYVKVVNKINRCAKRTSASFIGCAPLGKPTMVVEDLKDNGSPNVPLEGILWAHEFGHTQGLSHSVASSCPVCEAGVCYDACLLFPPPVTVTRSLMNPTISTSTNVVSQAQCDAFMQPIPTPNIPCNVCEAGVCYNQCNLGFGAYGDAPTGEQVDIQDFVKRVYPDSVPFQEAMQYGAETIPVLEQMLEDSAEREHWPMIATVLGIIGDDRSADSLIGFIERAREGRIKPSEYRAIGSALVALGYLAERSGSEPALDFLAEASEPSFWDRKSGMRWTSAAAPSPHARSRRMSEFAIMGMGLSGRPEAMRMLRLRWNTLNEHRGQGSDEEQEAMMRLVEQSMDDHGRVSRHGLATYYQK